MKLCSTLLFFLILLMCSMNSDEGKRIVPVDLKTLDGKTVNSSTFVNDSAPLILVFWISYHKNPVKELDAIAEHYIEWRNETGVRLIAVAVDDARTSWKVGSVVMKHEWEYDIYLDPNQDFKRGMNVNDVPHTLVMDKTGTVTWEKVGYTEGDEDVIYKALIKATQ